MSRMTVVFMVAALLASLAAPAMAGGPPRLCLPIDGVTSDNAAVCTRRIGDALDARGVEHGDVEILHHGGQGYVVVSFNVPYVTLSTIESALDGSPFSIPRHKLRPFGHAVLVIDGDSTASDDLIDDLNALEHVEVDESELRDGALLVTLRMPYWMSGDVFHEMAASSRKASHGDVDDAAPVLSSYDTLRDVVSRHHARLRDLRWKCLACRMLGCVASASDGGDDSASTAVRLRQ